MELDPDDLVIDVNLMRVHRELGEFEAVLESSQRFEEKGGNPREPIVLRLVGEAHFMLEHIGQAGVYLQEYLKTNPEDAAILQLMGIIAQSIDAPEGSIPYFERSYRLNPDDPVTLIHLSSSFYDIGEYRKCATCLEKIIDEDREDIFQPGTFLQLTSAGIHGDQETGNEGALERSLIHYAGFYQRIDNAEDQRVEYCDALVSLLKDSDPQAVKRCADKVAEMGREVAPLVADILHLAGKLYLHLGDKNSASTCFAMGQAFDSNSKANRDELGRLCASQED